MNFSFIKYCQSSWFCRLKVWWSINKWID